MRGMCRRRCWKNGRRAIRSTRFRKVILDRGAGSEKDLDDIDTSTREYAAKEADLAVDEPMPDPAAVARGVYAGDDFAVPAVELVRVAVREVAVTGDRRIRRFVLKKNKKLLFS